MLNNSCYIIEKELAKIAEIAMNSEFEEICEFKVDIIENTPIFDCLKIDGKVQGIYLIEIKRDVLQDYNNWISILTKRFRGREDNEKYFLHKFTPNIIEKRKMKHKDSNKDWVPFYLGKSKDIRNRLMIHIFSPLGKPPFALKLKDRKNTQEEHVFRDEIFRLKVINLNCISAKVYDSVVSHFEKILREKYSPIVGKQ